MFQKQAQSYNSAVISGLNKGKNDPHPEVGMPTIFPTQNSGVLPMISRQSSLNAADIGVYGWQPKFLAGKNLKGHMGTSNSAWFPANT